MIPSSFNYGKINSTQKQIDTNVEIACLFPEKENIQNFLITSITDPGYTSSRSGIIVNNIQYTEKDIEYLNRIEELHNYAVHDEISINQNSESDFWLFIEKTNYTRTAELGLKDNGNFRAVWDWGEHGHLGIEFFGDNQIQYVIFRKSEYEKKILREAANSTFEGIMELIKTYKLEIYMGYERPSNTE